MNYDNEVIYMHTDKILYIQMAYYVVEGYITVDFTMWWKATLQLILLYGWWKAI
jgi:hypothetical protein